MAEYIPERDIKSLLRARENAERAKEIEIAEAKANVPTDDLPLYHVGPLSEVPMQVPQTREYQDSTQKPLGIKIWEAIGAVKDFLRPHVLFGDEAKRAYQERAIPSMDPDNWPRTLLYDFDSNGSIYNVRYAVDSDERIKNLFPAWNEAMITRFTKKRLGGICPSYKR